MEQKFGWCFIGCGRLAQQVARQIIVSGRHEIRSVYAHRAQAAREFAGEYAAKACESAEEAIMAPGVRGVYIVTPHNSHYQYAMLALKLGKPVLCEKAFTVTAAQARELAALAEERRLYLAEAMWTWFTPVANGVKAWMDRGEFGRIHKANVNFHRDVRSYAPRITDPHRAGGALLDMGVYPITYFYRLFGKPEKIRCTGIISDGIDWEEEIALQFPGGQSGTISVSIRDTNGRPGLLLEGTKAKTEIPDFSCAKTARLVRKDGTAEEISGGAGYLDEFDHVAAEIRSGLLQSRFMPLRATVEVMEILDVCRAQMGLRYPFE